MCRRTRQIVAFVTGDRSEATCRLRWQAILQEYKHCQTYSDFWEAYSNVFPKETHHSVGKESGQTNHMERWNNTLRQWNARYTRKTLSFSKTDLFHNLVTRLLSFATISTSYHLALKHYPFLNKTQIEQQAKSNETGLHDPLVFQSLRRKIADGVLRPPIFRRGKKVRQEDHCDEVNDRGRDHFLLVLTSGRADHLGVT
jgi:IS1 family transposase